MHQRRFWLLPFLCFLSSKVIPASSRYVTPSLNDTAEDDIDLEEVLSDYYDNLVEIWSREMRKEAESARGREEEETVKPKRDGEKSSGNYNFLPGMKQVEAVSDNGTNSQFDHTVPVQIGNLTYRAVPIQIGNITYRFLNESPATVLDVQRASRERESVEGNSTRIKNMRLSSIKDSVLSLRGGNASLNRQYMTPKQTKTLTEMYEKHVRESPDWPASNMYAEKYQSFYPSCDVPRNVDANVWTDSNSMNLFFDVNFPSPPKDTTIMIVNAVLRLYTIPQANFTFPLGNMTVPGLKIQMDETSVSIPNFSLLNADDEKRIRISVYWHTRALRRQRVKKRLLDSQMMPIYGENNLTFNVRAAVRSWKESGSNFGLLVTVEDEYGNLLKPTNYINPMNCSKWAATVRPLPLFGFDSPAQYFIEDPIHFEDGNGTVNETNYDDESSHFSSQPVKYPILGLRMREVSLSEKRSLAKVLESGYLSMNRRNHDSKGKNPTSRITDFENVPLGSPISRGGPGKSPDPVEADKEKDETETR